MSNTKGRRLVIADWETQMREENSIILDLGDVGEIIIDPPLLWPKPTKGMSNERFIRSVVGKAQMDMWLGTGRTIEQLDAAFTHAVGLAVGESVASSTS